MTVERTEPPYIATDERANLVSWLEYHRATLTMKCAGLDDKQLRERAVPPSTLSLLGLVRHMADVERGWFRRTLVGEDAPRSLTRASARLAQASVAPASPQVVVGIARSASSERGKPRRSTRRSAGPAASARVSGCAGSVLGTVPSRKPVPESQASPISSASAAGAPSSRVASSAMASAPACLINPTGGRVAQQCTI